MPRIATKLTPARRGGFVARKAIPRDVAAAYGELFGKGPAWEVRLYIEPMPALAARARHREWSSEIEARIANIRAGRKGEGRNLTPQEARALAGEWYDWYVARVTAERWPKDMLIAYRDRMVEGLYSVAEAFDDGDPFDHADARHVRPVISDEAKTATYFAAKRLTLDPPSRDLFLDFITRDFFAALSLLTRRAGGDYGADKYADRFPAPHSAGLADATITPWSLFERWVAESKPAAATVNRWRTVFLGLKAAFPNTSAAALLSEEAHAWARGLIDAERSAATVRGVWVIACRTIFGWAITQKLVSRNPFVGWKITVPRKIRTRETKAFTQDEIDIILKSASAIEVRTKFDAAKRWCAWLAAYSGARMGEVTQLRGADVVKQDGIYAIKITPEAGSVKNRKPRTVPLHDHLIEQGFLAFVKTSGSGALFYTEAESVDDETDLTNPKRARAVQTRGRLAMWVRSVGIVDPELQPTHGWRHTFKAIGDRAGISEKTLDAIVGHAPASVGRGYGTPELLDKAEALKRFPRFKV